MLQMLLKSFLTHSFGQKQPETYLQHERFFWLTIVTTGQIDEIYAIYGYFDMFWELILSVFTVLRAQ